MKPHVGYTYLIRFKLTGQVYYGSRCAKGCHPDDLWVTYFTSSKLVHRLIDEHGKDSFDFEVRATFPESPKDAQEWERKVLRRINANRRQDFLNKHNGCFPALAGWKNPFFGKKHSEETKMKMRSVKRMKTTRRKMSSEQREKIGQYRRGKSYEQLYGEERASSIREKLARCGDSNPMFGRPRTEMAGDLNPSKRDEVREKIRLAKIANDYERFHCEVCNLDFDRANFSKSHGMKCWKAERECSVCKKLYLPKRKQGKTCSTSCGYKMRSLNQVEKHSQADSPSASSPAQDSLLPPFSFSSMPG